MPSYLIKTALAFATATAVSSCSPVDSQSNKSASNAQKKTAAITHSEKIGSDKHGMPTYTDESRSRHVRVTAYSHKENEKGAPGRKNAAGTILKYGRVRSAAADWSRLPLGTKFRVKGTSGITYIVDDYGSALAGTNTVDFFYPSLSSMRKWGTRKVDIEIIKMGSFERSAKLLKGRLHASHCRKMYYAITKKSSSKSFAKN